MDLRDFYRKLTADGLVYVQMGKIVIKDADALLDIVHKVVSEEWSTGQKIVFFTLGFQEAHQLGVVQAMQFWTELSIAARNNHDW